MGKTIAIAGINTTLGKLLAEKLTANNNTVIEFTDSAQLAMQPVNMVFDCSFPQTEKGSNIAEGLRFTKDLCLAAREAGVDSFVMVSSQRVYSSARDQAATEEEPVNPDSIFGMGIYAAEMICDGILGDIAHTSLRMATLYGENSNPGFINNLIKQTTSGKPFVAHGYEQIYGLITYQDASDALVAVVESDPSTWESVYNVGSQREGYTYDYILRTMSDIAKRHGYQPSFSVNYDCPWQNTSLDATRFMEQFGWSSAGSLSQSLEDVFDHYVVVSENAPARKRGFGLFGRKSS